MVFLYTAWTLGTFSNFGLGPRENLRHLFGPIQFYYPGSPSLDGLKSLKLEYLDPYIRRHGEVGGEIWRAESPQNPWLEDL